jgi:uncharacterized protein YcbX
MSAVVGRVVEVWRYPVKSMGGELLAEARLGPRGIVGDRGWALRDESAGEIRGAKKLPALMRCRARYDAEPDGDRVRRQRAPLGAGRPRRDDVAAAAGRSPRALPARDTRPSRFRDRAALDIRTSA